MDLSIISKLNLTDTGNSQWQFSEHYLNLVIIAYLALRLFSLSMLAILSLKCKLNVIFS